MATELWVWQVREVGYTESNLFARHDGQQAPRKKFITSGGNLMQHQTLQFNAFATCRSCCRFAFDVYLPCRT